jgi:autotransporter-associated beta strand protein
LEVLDDRTTPAVTVSFTGTTLILDLGAANDTATITGAGVDSVLVSGTGLSLTPEFGFNDIRVTGTGAANGQTVNFTNGVADLGQLFNSSGFTVTGVATVFVDATGITSYVGSITMTGAASITAGPMRAGTGITTTSATFTGPGITLSASGNIALNGLTQTESVSAGNGVGPDSAASGSINVTSTGGSISGTGRLVTGNATATGTFFPDSAASGSILLNAGGAVTLSAANALTVGFATVTGGVAGDTANDGSIAIKAGTGIGSVASPLSMQGSTLSAQTGTGGIFISNTGILTINGGVISGVNGVTVANSGNIQLTNAGSLSITNLGDIVQGPGNITLTAKGAAADLQTAGGNFVPTGAVQAGGSVSITAGRDVLSGSTGAGDIEAGGGMVLQAGRDIDVESFVQSYGTGTLTAAAGRNISLDNLITTQSAALVLTTGAGGVFTTTNEGYVGSSAAPGTGGPITITADDMSIGYPAGPALAGIDAGTGTVTLQPVTASRVISLGANVAGTLGLTDGELDMVTAGQLIIGNTANTGGIQLAGTITQANSGYSSLSLKTAGAITDNAGSVTVANLALQAGTGIGTATNAMTFDATALVTNSSANNADEFLSEAHTVSVTGLGAGTGTITLEGGTFSLGGNNAIAGASALRIAGAAVNLGPFSDNVAGVELDNGSITGTGTLSSVNGFDARTGSISATLGGTAGLVKTTTGEVTLTGANTYAGPTTINGGTLLIIGTQNGVGAVTVNNGGTLAGTGVIAAPVTVNSGGELLPGQFVTSPGILTTGSLQLATGATLVADLKSPYNTPGTDYPRVNVNGTVNLNSATLVLFGGTAAPSPGTALTIINNMGTSPVSGTFAGLPQRSTVTLGSFVGVINYGGGDGNDVTLTAANPTAVSFALAVPENTPTPLTLQGSDPANRPLTYTVTTQSQHGTLSGTAPNLTYTPAAGYLGSDTLQYKVNNGLLDSNIATVSISVFGPASVQSVVIDNGTAQRSMVRSVTVNFNRVVVFGGTPAAAFQVARKGPGQTGNVTLGVDLSGSTANQTVARLTFSGTLTEGPNSLVDGDYTLTVVTAQVQGGIQGGDNLTSLFRLYGDVNGDRTVNGLDLALFRTAFGTSLGNPNYVDYLDQNGDGAINGLDLAAFRTHFGTTLP